MRAHCSNKMYLFINGACLAVLYGNIFMLNLYFKKKSNTGRAIKLYIEEKFKSPPLNTINLHFYCFIIMQIERAVCNILIEKNLYSFFFHNKK